MKQVNLVPRREFHPKERPARTTKKPSLLPKEVRDLPPDVPLTGISRPGFLKPLAFTLFVSSGSVLAATIYEYERIRKGHLAKWVEDNLYVRKATGIRNEINSYWQSLAAVQKAVFGIVGLNVAVFLMWRRPQLGMVMQKYFMCAPTSPLSSMLLSTFSHVATFHLAANMYVLWTFSNALKPMGGEQFITVYVSGGMYKP
jgi:rhomboid-like protein